MAENSLETQSSIDQEVVKTSEKDKQKITILLKPTGDAPIIGKKKWVVQADQTVGDITTKIKRLLKLETNERIFLYVHQTFAPPPDQILQNLYDCYSTEGTLVLHYCKMQAWG